MALQSTLKVELDDNNDIEYRLRNMGFNLKPTQLKAFKKKFTEINERLYQNDGYNLNNN